MPSMSGRYNPDRGFDALDKGSCNLFVCIAWFAEGFQGLGAEELGRKLHNRTLARYSESGGQLQ
jgi:hypothetical protein